MADWAELLTQGAEGGGVGRMRMDYAIHFGPGFHDLGMNENLGVALVFTFDFFSAADIDDDDVLRANLFEAEAVRLHQNPILTRDAHGHVAEDIIPMAFMGQDITRVSQFFFQFFDIRSHPVTSKVAESKRES